MKHKRTLFKNIGTGIAAILLCASFFAFLYLRIRLSLGLMFAASIIGVSCSDDEI